MKNLFRLLLPLLAVSAQVVVAQPSSTGPLAPPANGPKRADSTWVAIHDTTVHVNPTSIMTRATVVFRNGLLTGVLPGEPGPDGVLGTPDDQPARLPLGPRVIDGRALRVYPGLIEAYAEVEAPLPAANASGLHPNPKVTPQRTALDAGWIDEGLASALRKLGFAAAGIAPKDGIFRGSNAVVSLAKPATDPSAAKPPVYAAGGYQVVGFDTGGGYPSALMGSIAVIRQTLLDAKWYESQPRVASDVPSCLGWLTSNSNAKATAPSTLLFDCSTYRALTVASIFTLNLDPNPNTLVFWSWSCG
jgi:hypothetical protein